MSRVPDDLMEDIEAQTETARQRFEADQHVLGGKSSQAYESGVQWLRWLGARKLAREIRHAEGRS
jgi:hypothetical protein